jgi:hypothetical protein
MKIIPNCEVMGKPIPRQSAAAKPCDQAAVDALLDKIRAEQVNVNSREGPIVASLLRICMHVAELRGLVKKDWSKRLKQVGMNARVASRYVQIGKSWLGQIGLTESDLLSRLPTDLLKLEWLCRLSTDQLDGLLAQMDCKKTSRGQVIAAVKGILGDTDSDRPVPNAEKAIQRVLNRLLVLSQQAIQSPSPPEGLPRIRTLLQKGAREIQAIVAKESSQTLCGADQTSPASG